MNNTKWDRDWIVLLINTVEKLVISVDRIKQYLQKYLNERLVKDSITTYAKRIHATSTTPRGSFGRKYAYIKFTLIDDIEKMLMEDASRLNVYLLDYSYLDLSDRTFYICGKSSAQRFLLADDTTVYRDTHIINKYIKSGDLFDNLFYIEQISKEEYKQAPDNKKIKVIKDIK